MPDCPQCSICQRKHEGMVRIHPQGHAAKRLLLSDADWVGPVHACARAPAINNEYILWPWLPKQHCAHRCCHLHTSHQKSCSAFSGSSSKAGAKCSSSTSQHRSIVLQMGWQASDEHRTSAVHRLSHALHARTSARGTDATSSARIVMTDSILDGPPCPSPLLHDGPTCLGK